MVTRCMMRSHCWLSSLFISLVLFVSCSSEEPRVADVVAETTLTGKAYTNITIGEDRRYTATTIIFYDDRATIYQAKESLTLPYPPEFGVEFATVHYNYDHKKRAISFNQENPHERELKFEYVGGTTEGKGLELIKLNWGLEPNVKALILHRIPLHIDN